MVDQSPRIHYVVLTVTSSGSVSQSMRIKMFFVTVRRQPLYSDQLTCDKYLKMMAFMLWTIYAEHLELLCCYHI